MRIRVQSSHLMPRRTLAVAVLVTGAAAGLGCREPREQHEAKVTARANVDIAPGKAPPRASASVRPTASAASELASEPQGRPDGAPMPTGLFTPGCARTSKGAAWCWGPEPTQGVPTPFTSQAAASGELRLQARRVRALDFATSVASAVFTYFIDGRGALWVTGTARNVNLPDAMHEYATPARWRPDERFERVSSNSDVRGRADICALSSSTLLCWTEGYLYDESMGPFLFDRGAPTVVATAPTQPAQLPTHLAVAYAGVYYALSGTLRFVGTQAREPASSPHDGVPFQGAGAAEPLNQAGSVQAVAAAVESNQGCVLRDDRTVACFRRALWQREVPGSFDPVPGLSEVVELSRGLAYYATLANGERYAFRVLKKPALPITAVPYIERPRRVPVLEGGQLLGDRTHEGPDCQMKDGRVLCWFELDAKTLAPKQLLEVAGLPVP